MILDFYYVWTPKLRQQGIAFSFSFHCGQCITSALLQVFRGEKTRQSMSEKLHWFLEKRLSHVSLWTVPHRAKISPCLKALHPRDEETREGITQCQKEAQDNWRMALLKVKACCLRRLSLSNASFKKNYAEAEVFDVASLQLALRNWRDRFL